MDAQPNPYSNESTEVQTPGATWRVVCCGGHANALQVVTVDKSRVLLVVRYHNLVYSQAAPVFIQHLLNEAATT